jgi:hypothetical protein
MPMGKGKKNPQYMHTLSSKKLEGKKKKTQQEKKLQTKTTFLQTPQKPLWSIPNHTAKVE